MIGRFTFIFGLRMLHMLLGWWVYDITNSKLALGLVGLAEVIPAIGFALYAGHVIDISEKKKLLLMNVSFYCISILGFVFLSIALSQNYISKSSVVALIFVFIFITGVIRSFTGPCFGAIIGYIVPKDLLPNAATINSAVWLGASVLGHAASGFSIGYLGYTTTLSIIVFIILTSILFLSSIKPTPVEHKTSSSKTWDSILEGLRFVWKTKDLLATISLDLFAVLFGGVVALIPVFAKDILKVGPVGAGWLNAASDIGSIIIVITLAFFPLNKNQGKKLLIVVAGFGISIIVFALSKVFWLSFFALLVSGLLDGISVVIRGTILQLKTPQELRGRVMAVNSMFINSSNELGMFESGLAASLMGTIPSVIFGGSMTILIVLFTWIKFPALKRLKY